MCVVVVGSQLVACGPDDDGGGAEIADQPLSGTLAGAGWNYTNGTTDPWLSDDETLFGLLVRDNFGCDFGTVSFPLVSFAMPTEPGEYEMGPGHGVTFTVGDNENLNVMEGVLVVDEVTETTASGRMRAVYDADNEVEGTFEVDICPPP
jgi:hypothetical protein